MNAVVSGVVLMLALAGVHTLAQENSGKAQDAQIADIIARIDNLRQEDYELLRHLGDVAYRVIYPLATESIEGYRPNEERADTRRRFYLVRALTSCAKANKTEEMTGLFSRLDGFPRGTVFDWLAFQGDPGPNRDLFIAVISEESEDGAFNGYRTSAVDGLMRVGDAKSIRTLTETLLDERADERIRSHILRVVAKTRDPAALGAVRKIAQKGLTAPKIPTTAILQESYGYFSNKFPLEHIDSDGVGWGLIMWDGLGSDEDLWLARKSGNDWEDPLFTGIDVHVQVGLPSGVMTAEGTEHARTIIALLADNGWVASFVGSPVLSLDSDGDGYTDIVEKWIGLSPTNPDTDGDGLKDSQDKNPLVPARPLSEEDRVLSMAFAAVVGASATGRHTFVEFGDGIEPFELQAASGVVLPALSPEQYTRQRARSGITVTLGNNFRNDPAVIFGDDRLTATVAVSEDRGYSASSGFVKLIKIDGQWYPTALIWTMVGGSQARAYLHRSTLERP